MAMPSFYGDRKLHVYRLSTNGTMLDPLWAPFFATSEDYDATTRIWFRQRLVLLPAHPPAVALVGCAPSPVGLLWLGALFS